MVMVRWIQFYESIYELDSVQRPREDIINNDTKLDEWFNNYQAYATKRLIEYHKSQKTPHADTGLSVGLVEG